MRSVISVGVALTYLPTPQVVAVVQDTALAPEEKLTPSAHDTHVRSYVIEGGGLEN